MDLHALLARAVELGGSDIHLKLGTAPMARVDGEITAIGAAPLAEHDLDSVLTLLTEGTPARGETFAATGDLDTSYTTPAGVRFRVNGFRQRGAISFAFRYVPNEVPSFDTLGLPEGVQRLADERRGLVLVTGATGSGKSTTLAAMIDRINRTRREHIVTIEDPIEIVHQDRGCIVNQREVGIDTQSFMQALRRALRQDPDVILIGELRDEESAQAALQAAESGHLVLSTLHTLDAAETIGRLVQLFPASKQPVVRQILARGLRGVGSQRLLPRAGGGRVAAVEVMVNTARIADLIRDPHKTELIPDAIGEGSFHHMQTFAQHLVQLVLEGTVELEVAAGAASNRHDFELVVQQALRQQRTAEPQPEMELEPAAETAEPSPPSPPPPPAAEFGLRLAAD